MFSSNQHAKNVYCLISLPFSFEMKLFKLIKNEIIVHTEKNIDSKMT